MELNNETELIQKAKKGDTRSFELLMDRYFQLVFGLVMRIVRGRMESEDVTQEVFIRVFRHLGKFREQSKFSTWVSRIAINESYKSMKKLQVKRAHTSDEQIEQIPETHPNPLEDVLEEEKRSMLYRLIAELPEKQRTVLILRLEQSLQFNEIARVMKRSVGTVKANYFHGVNKIKVAVKKEMHNGLH